MKKRSSELLGIGIDYQRLSKAAPKVVASEHGTNVSQMIRIARRYGVKVHKDDSLADSLSVLEVDEEIPESLYSEVAELLVHYDLD